MSSQEIRTTRLELSGPAWNGVTGAFIGTRETIPLVLGTTAPTAQPIRFLVGPAGVVRALEISSAGETWMQGPVAIGPSTGTIAGTHLRVADIPSTGGIGLARTTTSTGLAVQNIGTNGSDHAGLVFSSTANGVGTGARFGGPSGSGRPTLLTAIDVTGGTGMRYNALSAGQGTAIEIGGTTSPQRGIDIKVSGSDHVGVYARSNTLGTGLIGISVSGSYADPPVRSNTGIFGYSASSSAATADTLTGVSSLAERGGRGGRQTTTLGMRAQASSNASQHAGTAIGILAEASSLSPGVSVAIGGLFRSSAGGLSLATFDGDVYLGSSNAERPPTLADATTQGAGTSMTHVFGLRSSGPLYRTGTLNVVLAAGLAAAPNVQDADLVLITSNAAGSELDGLAGGNRGRLITLINREGVLLLHNNGVGAGAGETFALAQGADVVVPPDGAVTLWYDDSIGAWRLIGRSW